MKKKTQMKMEKLIVMNTNNEAWFEKAKKIVHDKRNKILQDTNLLLNIINEIGNHVVGFEDTKLVLINKICLRLVENADKTSSNLIVSDKSGAGKDYLVKHTCDVLLKEEETYFHRTYLSSKVLNYWQPRNGWDEKVLYIEDPNQTAIKEDAIRTLSSGTNITTVVNDKRKAIDTRITGKPVMIVTSLNATIDEEGIRRWDAIGLDISEAQTRAIKNYQLKKASGYDTRENIELLGALGELQRVHVTIPEEYAERIKEIVPDNILARTGIGRILDFIKSSTALHQYQRQLNDDKEGVIANEFDFYHGLLIFSLLNKTYGQALNVYEQKIMESIKDTNEDNPKKVMDIKNEVKISKQKTYDLLNELENKGLVLSTKKWDDDSNKKIIQYYISGDFKNSFKIGKTSNFVDFRQPKTTKKTTNTTGEITPNSGCLSIYFNLYREIENNRKKLGLSPLNLLMCMNTFQKSWTTNKKMQFNRRKWLSIDEKTTQRQQKDIQDSCLDALDYIIEHEDTKENLIKIFGKKIISKLIENGDIIVTPEGEVVSKW